MVIYYSVVLFKFAQYLKLDMLRRLFPSVPIMALTATANKHVMEDAISRLGMRNAYRHVKSFNRPNLHYSVRSKRPSKIVDEIAEVLLITVSLSDLYLKLKLLSKQSSTQNSTKN